MAEQRNEAYLSESAYAEILPQNKLTNLDGSLLHDRSAEKYGSLAP
jgi:hypothetical protein